MTKLYNDLTKLRATRDSKRPVYPLSLPHEKLDAVVGAAYGRQPNITDDKILASLPAADLGRAAA